MKSTNFENAKEEILNKQSYILVKEVFCQEILNNNNLDISLKNSAILFEQYWEFVFSKMDNDSLPEPPVSLSSAEEFYQEYFFKKQENREKLSELLMDYYDYKTRRMIKLANV